MLKTCLYCGGIHKNPNLCKNKIPSKKNTDINKMRNLRIWALKSKEIREQAGYLCELCKEKNIYNYHNLEVHHVIPIKENPSLFLEDSNLICLCGDCHREVEGADTVTREKLFKIIQKRLEKVKGVFVG